MQRRFGGGGSISDDLRALGKATGMAEREICFFSWRRDEVYFWLG